MDTTEWVLKPMDEFRFEVAIKSTTTIKLIQGKAEIFGTELAFEVEYQFTGRKLAIFTWHGCKLECVGKNAVEYIGHETPMNAIINVHFALQQLRDKAATQDLPGPRVMIVGPSDVGKTTLAKTLASYAARNASIPILCDIDPSGGLISLPETISAMAIHRPLDPEEDFNASASLYKTTPIAYYYGSSDISDKKKLYTTLVSVLAKRVEEKLTDKLVKHAGIIIDTPSKFMDQGGLDLLTETIQSFQGNLKCNIQSM